ADEFGHEVCTSQPGAGGTGGSSGSGSGGSSGSGSGGSGGSTSTYPGCTGTPGYWKNHPSAWPVTSLTIGGVTYSQGDLMAIYALPVTGDDSINLAHQL